MNCQQLLDELKKMKNHYNADDIKIYYTTENWFCIKIIKGDKIIKCFRVRHYNKGVEK